MSDDKGFDLKIVLPLSAMVIIGSFIGAFFLKNTDTRIIKIIFGILVVIVGIEMLFRELAKKKAKNSRILLLVIGVISGLLCGLYGVGALLGAYIGRTTDNPRAFKANICTVFIIENTFRILMYFFYGILNINMLKRAVMLSPFMETWYYIVVSIDGDYANLKENCKQMSWLASSNK